MALPFQRRRPDELPTAPEFPPLPSDVRGAELRDLTGSGFQSADAFAGAQAADMRPAGPVFPRPGIAPPQQGQQSFPAGMPLPPAFTPPRVSSRTVTQEIEEIAEAIVSEKWEKFSKEVDDLKKDIDDVSASVNGVQERLANIEKRMDMVIQQVLGKVEDYGRSIADVSTELKAMQKVFGTMMPTMTENIKELDELVGKAKTEGVRRRPAARRKRRR